MVWISSACAGRPRSRGVSCVLQIFAGGAEEAGVGDRIIAPRGGVKIARVGERGLCAEDFDLRADAGGEPGCRELNRADAAVNVASLNVEDVARFHHLLPRAANLQRDLAREFIGVVCDLAAASDGFLNTALSQQSVKNRPTQLDTR